MLTLHVCGIEGQSIGWRVEREGGVVAFGTCRRFAEVELMMEMLRGMM